MEEILLVALQLKAVVLVCSVYCPIKTSLKQTIKSTLNIVRILGRTLTLHTGSRPTTTVPGFVIFT
jgi:hypothetical protein